MHKADLGIKLKFSGNIALRETLKKATNFA